MSASAEPQPVPAVSVVIPLYNRETLIPRAIASVQAQTLRDFELIVVDDGSTDGSARMVADLARGDSRIRLVSQENMGAGGARFRGIAEAGAEFVAFLDSDDYWEARYLEAQVGLLRDAPGDVVAVVCNGTAIEPGKADAPLFEEVGYEPPVAPRLLDSPRELWEPFQAPYLQGSVYRREALLRMDAFGPRLRTSEDFEVLVRMSFAGRFIVNPANLFVQDRGRDGTESLSQSTKLKPNFFEARCLAARFAYRHDRDAELRRRDKTTYLAAFRSWMRSLAAAGRYGDMIVRLPRAFDCGFDVKSAVFALLMLSGPLGAGVWERLSAARESGKRQIAAEVNGRGAG